MKSTTLPKITTTRYTTGAPVRIFLLILIDIAGSLPDGKASFSSIKKFVLMK
jgi:hypothetical protein